MTYPFRRQVRQRMTKADLLWQTTEGRIPNADFPPLLRHSLVAQGVSSE